MSASCCLLNGIVRQYLVTLVADFGYGSSRENCLKIKRYAWRCWTSGFHRRRGASGSLLACRHPQPASEVAGSRVHPARAYLAWGRQGARSALILLGRNRRRQPRLLYKVKKLLAHVRLGCVSFGQGGDIEARLDQLKDRRVVHLAVRDEVLLAER